MTTKEFIEKAIEGGWNRYVWVSYIKNETYGRGGYGTRTIPTESVFLDPLAWQAVGKVEGWRLRDEEDVFNGGYLEDDEWLKNMHCMIDALAEGKPIEQFLATL